MEAWRFGFDPSLLPPANKFDPTDTDIVVRYLLPRAVGVPNPHEHAVIDGDPCSCPPWEFMRRHGHADSDHAFFFPPPRARGDKRPVRAVSPGKDDDGGIGGRWDAQKSTVASIVIARGDDGGAETTIEYKRCNLSYCHGDEPSTSGWVMHEYQITVPPRLSGTVLSRVKITDRGKQRLRKAALGGDRQRQVAVPAPDQPGPSNYYDYDDFVRGRGHVDGGGGNALGSSGGEQSEVANLGDGNCSVMAETAAYFLDDGNGYFNDGSGYYYGSGGDYCFNVGDSNVDHEYHQHDGGSEG